MAIQGIILPPPDIRAVADKTALFVSKNGRAFERRILNSEKGQTPKFSFLHDTSPFHAYYEDRIRFFESGGDKEEGKEKKEQPDNKAKKEENSSADVEEKKETDGSADSSKPATGGGAGGDQQPKSKKERSRKASAVDPIARALLAARSQITAARKQQEENIKENTSTSDPNDRGEENSQKEASPTQDTVTTTTISLPPPPNLLFVSPAAPSGLSPAQIEIIKLTAQCAALAGRGSHFLRQLLAREYALSQQHNNDSGAVSRHRFDFVQPRHAHFAYFTALVDCYRALIWEALDSSSEEVKLELGPTLLSYYSPKDEFNDAKGSLDLVKICTTKGKRGALELAAYRTEYDRDVAQRRRDAARQQQASDGNIVAGGSASIDWHDFVVVETIDFDINETVDPLPPLPPPPPPPPPPVPTDVSSTIDGDNNNMEQSSSDEDEGEDGNADENDQEEIKVVGNYKPRVVSSAAARTDTSRTHVVDPITGKSVPVSDMPENLRIRLLDPKWSAERKRFQEKQRDSNLVHDIASNVDRFARTAGTLFGGRSREEELLSQEEENRRRLEEANRIIREQAMMAPQGPTMPPPLTTTTTTGGAKPVTTTIQPASSSHVTTISTTSLPSSQVPTAPPYSGVPTAPTLDHPAPTQGNSDVFAPAVKKQKLMDTSPATLASPPSDGMPAPPPPPSAAVPSVSSPSTVALPPPPLPPNNNNDTSSAAAAPPDAASASSGDKLLSESEFMATLPNPTSVPIAVRIPNDSSFASWNFRGQTIALSVNVKNRVKSLKESLSSYLGGMPINKMQLRRQGNFFLRDASSMASMNIGQGDVLELLPKLRGGRK